MLWKRPCYCKSRKCFLSKVVVRILFVKNISLNFNTIIIEENLLKIVFSLHCRSPYLRILLRLISKNTTELYKNFMTVQNPCFNQDLEPCRNSGILFKKFQCNEAINEAIFEWQIIKMFFKTNFSYNF